ncbi:MAG: hypothetical protein ACI8Z5_002460 [Lentimonas sp.]
MDQPLHPRWRSSIHNPQPYDQARVERDASTLDALSNEMIALTSEVASLKRALSFREQPY